MTPDSARPRDLSIEFAADIDLLAGLWQEASFARLPPDAPPEIKTYIQTVGNPARVYAIHQASRRHGFQLLVERYILQLRSGCDNVNCATPTCFTCRRRLAGKAPIRRYNTTSARTLAIYLASQDNPDRGLCPFLRKSQDPPAALSNLIFSTRPPSPSHPDYKRPSVATPPGIHKERFSRSRSPSSSSQDAVSHTTNDTNPPTHPGNKRAVRGSPYSDTNDTGSQIQIIEGPTSKDHRSFAANLLGTVRFKMLEWLTPKSVAVISEKISSLEKTRLRTSVLESDTPQEPSGLTESSTNSDSHGTSHIDPNSIQSTNLLDQLPEPGLNGHLSTAKSSRTRHGSVSKSWSSATPRSRKGSEVQNTTKVEEGNKAVKIPQVTNSLGDKSLRPKSSKNPPSRSIPEMPLKSGFFENAAKPATQSLQSINLTSVSPSEDFNDCEQNPHLRNTGIKDGSALRETGSFEEDSLVHQLPSQNNIFPQALSRLDVNLVDFICDVFEEDGTAEATLRSTYEIINPYPKPANKGKPLRRQAMLRTTKSKKQWSRFNEQTLFNVLADPLAVVQSFTHEQELYDSQTLWYCFHRLSRVASSLVFHSLWLAAGRLFIPPQELEPNEGRSGSGSQKHVQPLTDQDAGFLMSICMHALVAAAPIVPDSRTLYEMSRVRSHGFTLAGGSIIARQPASRCLDYDDAFSNDLATRLARRVFCAVIARRCFAHNAKLDGYPNHSIKVHNDVLQPLVDQLDFLTTGAASILEFPQSERLLHETRVPTILLDWARAILLSEWNGRADFVMDGPFGGALSFIETLHVNRNLLLLGDVQFRVDYLSERLDSVEMPVNWLAFKSTRWQRHILDYPYIFSPDTLVSFFRSINFARMSRMFEESSSLKTRMSAIVDPGSLITNPHHKMVLQDLLRTASSKYLVLEIGRHNVARDAFDQLWRREKRELLRPLKVHLGENSGEEGFDSGGVQQEFFRLAIAECLDPEYGAFTVDERTRMAWFTPGSLTEDWKYELVGLLVSLALYNGLTLPITFPKALYRKLLGKSVEELHHIADGWPDLASGLTTLLEWDEKDGLVEDIFARTYEFSVSSLGTIVTREMKLDGKVTWPGAVSGSNDMAPPQMDNPDDAPLVTNDNRDDYIIDYIRYLTDVSIRRQYLAFERGFNSCLAKKSLSLLSPSTLQSLVEGVQEIDIAELKRYARYVGWDTSHRTIKDFWSIVKRYDERMKQRLLEFVTSSDRVPVGGMKNLQFVIQKNGEEDGTDGHLPTAYTCYGTLLLPEYRDKEVLRERLGMALENAQGFGFA
ncbi:hypothetical protein FHETE_10031 [Fusarium heterosporum]|uniref:HECT-type E3 ubiquitin transferase n=1 Tax=Fusarium heterosporum TaxID=42747 RepID=A0A8H5WHB6_FUSHE|nr:hypothetical protein FHETE_10031 [Fusarium heterosporum]